MRDPLDHLICRTRVCLQFAAIFAALGLLSVRAQIVYHPTWLLMESSSNQVVGYFNVITGQTASQGNDGTIPWDLSVAVSSANYPAISNAFSTSGRTVRVLFDGADLPIIFNPTGLISGATPGFWRDGWYLNYGGNQTHLRNDATPEFLALQILDGANTYYGWVQLSYYYAGGSYGGLALQDFAYSSVANASILAGQTSAIPEPATATALIGLTVAGLAIVRRRAR